MLLKSCSRCGNLIPFGQTYCSTCAPIVEQQRLEYKRQNDRKYNKQRDQKYIRFYNSKEWRVLALKYTQDKGYRCECCGAMATQVHHIKPIQTDDGWSKRLDYDNLELLCTDCHNNRHDRFKRRKPHAVRRSQSATESD